MCCLMSLSRHRKERVGQDGVVYTVQVVTGP